MDPRDTAANGTDKHAQKVNTLDLTATSSRRDLNAELHQRAAETQPAVTRGVAGKGAATLSARLTAATEHDPRDSRAAVAAKYAKGTEGEHIIAEKLSWLTDNYWVLHDQPWPGRPQANIDHIVVGPTGITIVDAKHWSGTLTLDGRGLRQNGRPRGSAITSVRAQVEALKSLTQSLPLADAAEIPVQGVLAFTSDSGPHGENLGVSVTNADLLCETICAFPQRIAPAAVAQVAYVLEEALDEDRLISKATARKRRAAARDGHADTLAVPEVEPLYGETNQLTCLSPARPARTKRASKRAQTAGTKISIRKILSKTLKYGALVSALYVVFYRPDILSALSDYTGELLGSLVTALLSHDGS
ncbi:nuclease-related domain-containing protein [Populibacterium corticicola]|uniref:Nuclease-related domain-containing protein n=1 Tax=Populibacterium corticicola TaxID=1812826 RepID=A0ABW5XDL5_9MICO